MSAAPMRAAAGGTIGAALAAAAAEIGALDARVLLRHVLGCDEARLIASSEQPLAPAHAATFAELCRRRAAGEPVAYLTGSREFYGLAFRVSPAVLVPRPETELLVELALARIAPGAPCRVLDLATGCGCVAVAIARARPAARVVAADVSPQALELARENAARLEAANVECVLSDWYDRLGGARFDLIVANPPYVAEGDPHLASGDLRHEPRAALVAGPDGLECIRLVVSGARAHLVPGGWLLFEHGYGQAERCRRLLERAGFVELVCERDLAGIERASGGRCPGD